MSAISSHAFWYAKEQDRTTNRSTPQCSKVQYMYSTVQYSAVYYTVYMHTLFQVVILFTSDKNQETCGNDVIRPATTTAFHLNNDMVQRVTFILARSPLSLNF